MPLTKTTSDNIKSQLEGASQSLIKLARESSYNRISNNLKYIIRIVDQEFESVGSFFDQYKLRKKINETKPILSLDDTANDLKKYFDVIYEINLSVFKSSNTTTIIEIEIREKDETVELREGAPFLHCNVGIPPYAKNKEKFDINWQLGTWDHKWKMFWWQRRTRREIRQLKRRHITSATRQPKTIR